MRRPTTFLGRTNIQKFSIAILAVAVLLLLAVLVSLAPSDMWFVRAIDLVREPMAYFAAMLLMAAFLINDRKRPLAIIALAIVIGINVWRIWPYSAFAATEMAIGDHATDTDRVCFTAMSVNVKVKNRDYDRISKQIEQRDPDVLFLMETDQRWINNLSSVLSTFPNVVTHPQPKAFGLVFASRLPVVKTNVVENTYRDTPTLYATLTPSPRSPVEFIGLHPKPPLPGWNTELRDKNIVNAALQTPDRLPDAIVMGDFNDVPWSRTTERFKETGGWKDPRVGRGTYPTFPANITWLGWPLDQLMVKGNVAIEAFEVLPENGSDHRAVFARFCH